MNAAHRGRVADPPKPRIRIFLHALVVLVSMAMMIAGLVAIGGSAASAEEGPEPAVVSSAPVDASGDDPPADADSEPADEESTPDGQQNGGQPGEEGGGHDGGEPGEEGGGHDGGEPGEEGGGHDGGEPGEEGGGHDGGEPAPALVCVATSDPEAPYTAALYAPQDIINGHGQPKENGPAASPVTGVFPDEAWGNIIPPVAHPNGAEFPGLNWGPEGQAVHEDGCGVEPPDAPPGGHGDHQKLTVCLATADRDAPYTEASYGVQQIINGEGVPKGQHSPARNPVTGVFPDDVWGNIIPPFTHTNQKATYDGLNWTEAGQSILSAGCVYVPPTPEPPPAPAPAPAPPAAVTAPPPEAAPEPIVPLPIEPVVEPATLAEPASPSRPVIEQAPTVVAAPAAATLPQAIPAGDGTTAPTAPQLPILLIGLGLAGALLGLTGLARPTGTTTESARRGR